MKYLLVILFFCLWQASMAMPGLVACDTVSPGHENIHAFPSLSEHMYDSIFRAQPAYWSDGFDYPVGKPDAQGYYKAQEFGESLHLGEDWNGLGGGNTDLGDAVYVSANGLVTFVADVCCGWGYTVRVVHAVLKPTGELYYVESVYGHLHYPTVRVGDLVRRGDKLGAIGTAHGRYLAHLHFEIRSFINMALGPAYSEDNYGYLQPTAFIEANRPLR